MEIPSELLESCQKTSYEVLEDMRLLYTHWVVADDKNRVDQFLNLVNRTHLVKQSDPDILRAREPLHLNFEVPADSSPEQTLGFWRQTAEELLAKFEKARESNRELLPPPFWLRLLPRCCSIIAQSNLFHKGGPAFLRWLAFNVEVPGIKRNERVQSTVNINANKILPGIRLESLSHSTGQNCNALSDILFDLTRAVAPPQGPRELFEDVMPYISWGIRFRTTQIATPEVKGPWVDICIALNNKEGLPQKEDKYSFLRTRSLEPPGYPFPQDRKWIGFVDKIFKKWAFPTEEDPSRVERDQPSEQIREYCRTLQHFYPRDHWPKEGIDTLLCPAVFWSLDENNLGTAATIFWGFEGPLELGQCNLLLLLSQTLLSGIGQFARIAGIKETGKEEGSFLIQEDFSHETRHLVAFAKKGVEFLTNESVPGPKKRVLSKLIKAAHDHIDRWAISLDQRSTEIDFSDFIRQAKYIGFICRYRDEPIANLLSDLSKLSTLFEDRILIKVLQPALPTMDRLQPIRKALLAGLSNAIQHVLPSSFQELLNGNSIHTVLFSYDSEGIRVYNEGKYENPHPGGTEEVMRRQVPAGVRAEIINLDETSPLSSEEQQLFKEAGITIPIVRTAIQLENAGGDS